MATGPHPKLRLRAVESLPTPEAPPETPPPPRPSPWHIALQALLWALAGALMGITVGTLAPVTFSAQTQILFEPVVTASAGNGSHTAISPAYLATQALIIASPAVRDHLPATLRSPETEVSAAPGPGTWIVRITARSPSAETARALAEGLATAYVSWRAGRELGPAGAAITAAGTAAAQAQIEAAERAAFEYRIAHGLLAETGAAQRTAQAKRVDVLQARLAELTLQRLELETLRAAVERFRKAHPAAPLPPWAEHSRLLATLPAREAELRAAAASTAQDLAAEAATAPAQAPPAPGKSPGASASAPPQPAEFAAAVAFDLQVLKDTEARLQQALEETTNTAAALAEHEFVAAQLQREAEALRAAYQGAGTAALEALPAPEPRPHILGQATVAGGESQAAPGAAAGALLGLAAGLLWWRRSDWLGLEPASGLRSFA